MQVKENNRSIQEIIDDEINRIRQAEKEANEMSVREFKEYLDKVVKSAFNVGVDWSMKKTISKDEAIKNAQYRILIEGDFSDV